MGAAHLVCFSPALILKRHPSSLPALLPRGSSAGSPGVLPVGATPGQVSTAKSSVEGGLTVANMGADTCFLDHIHVALPAKPNQWWLPSGGHATSHPVRPQQPTSPRPLLVKPHCWLRPRGEAFLDWAPPSTWARGSGASSLGSRASPTGTHHVLWLPRDPATQLSPLTFGFPFFGFGYLWSSTTRKC